jgi:hypothetical protein
MHLPPHTCATDHAADAARTAADNVARTAADNVARTAADNVARTAADNVARTAADAELTALKTFDAVAFNRAAEKAFIELARRLAPCSVSHLIREASFALDISPETAKRYLFKHTAAAAEFEVVSGVVLLKNRVV